MKRILIEVDDLAKVRYAKFRKVMLQLHGFSRKTAMIIISVGIMFSCFMMFSDLSKYTDPRVVQQIPKFYIIGSLGLGLIIILMAMIYSHAETNRFKVKGKVALIGLVLGFSMPPMIYTLCKWHIDPMVALAFLLIPFVKMIAGLKDDTFALFEYKVLGRR